MSAIEQQVQQLHAQLQQSQQQVRDLALQIDGLRNESEAAFLQLRAAGGQPRERDEDRDMQLFDIKSLQPSTFNGRRGEVWKAWAKRIKAFCNARTSCFRQALDVSEREGGPITSESMEQMDWQQMKTADSKLYDVLLLVTGEDAQALVEQFEGQGFEAWRQLSKRWNPTGGQYELFRIMRLMTPTTCKDMGDLPGVIDRFERDVRAYEQQSGKTFPDDWRVAVLMQMIPNLHRKEIEGRYQLGLKS